MQQVTPGSAAFALLPVAGADGTVEASPLDELENTPPLVMCVLQYRVCCSVLLSPLDEFE